MVTLLLLDYVVIILYFLALILIGYFTSRKQSNESFLISERKLGVWSGICTINATKTGGLLLTFVALLYLFGASAWLYFLGVGAGYLIFLPFAKKLHRKSKKKYYTLADYYYANYGKVSGHMASGLTILIMVGSLFLNLIAASKAFEFFTGISFWVSAIIVAGVVLIYLLLAGSFPFAIGYLMGGLSNQSIPSPLMVFKTSKDPILRPEYSNGRGFLSIKYGQRALRILGYRSEKMGPLKRLAHDIIPKICFTYGKDRKIVVPN